MNYIEAREYLEKVNKYGSVLGLDSIFRLLDKLDNPHDELKVVHIAGTNGKGSTMAFLQNIIQRAGYKVGRYSSPAVFEYREIITIDNQYIKEEQLAELLTMVKGKCDEIVSEGFPHPTPFEIETAMALLYFKRQKCDIVLIECGMGGETDATNVFKKVLCSIIATISLDHTKFLGDTITKIATIKSGIIKKNCPVVVANQEREVLKVIKDKCKEQNSKLTITGNPSVVSIRDMKTTFDYLASNNKTYRCVMTMMGTHQLINVATAIEVAIILENQGFKLEDYIDEGIRETLWNGRLEVLSRNPMIVIDGAHNPGAVAKLKESIDLYFTNKRITFIMGVLADKNFDEEARVIAGAAVKIITVTPNNQRALDSNKLADTVSKYNANVTSADSINEGYLLAKQSIKNNEADVILAFGSLSYLGELKRTIVNS